MNGIKKKAEGEKSGIDGIIKEELTGDLSRSQYRMRSLMKC